MFGTHSEHRYKERTIIKNNENSDMVSKTLIYRSSNFHWIVYAYSLDCLRWYSGIFFFIFLSFFLFFWVVVVVAAYFYKCESCCTRSTLHSKRKTVSREKILHIPYKLWANYFTIMSFHTSKQLIT